MPSVFDVGTASRTGLLCPVFASEVFGVLLAFPLLYFREFHSNSMLANNLVERNGSFALVVESGVLTSPSLTTCVRQSYRKRVRVTISAQQSFATQHCHTAFEYRPNALLDPARWVLSPQSPLFVDVIPVDFQPAEQGHGS